MRGDPSMGEPPWEIPNGGSPWGIAHGGSTTGNQPVQTTWVGQSPGIGTFASHKSQNWDFCKLSALHFGEVGRFHPHRLHMVGTPNGSVLGVGTGRPKSPKWKFPEWAYLVGKVFVHSVRVLCTP